MNKIGYYCSKDTWGGLEMNQLRNAIWMQKRGHNVVLFCIENSPLHLNAIAQEIPVQLIEKQERYYDFKKAKSLVALIQQLGVTHFVIRHTRDMSIAATLKWKLKDQIFIAYFMEMQMVVNKRSFLHSIRFHFFDLWSCPLHMLAEQVRKNSKMNRTRIVVIPSGIELEYFQQELSMSDARKELNLPIDGKILGMIGRFDVHKGQMLVLEAFSRIQQSDLSLCLIGEPTIGESLEYYDEMIAFIHEHELNERVFLRPFTKDVLSFYKAVNCSVMASESETVGMVTLESLASGTPVIGSNAGGTPEILQNGATGKLFTTLSVDSLKEQIESFVENSNAYSPTQLQESVQHFSHHAVCSAVEKALNL